MPELSVSKKPDASSHPAPARAAKVLLLLGFFLLGVMLPHGHAIAHSLGQSYVYLTMGDASVSGRLEITVPDLNGALEIDLSTNRDLTLADLKPYRTLVTDYVAARLRIFPDGQPATLGFGDLGLQKTSRAQYLTIEFSIDGPAGIPQYIDFEYELVFDKIPSHRGFVLVENDWKTGTFDNEAVISLIFDPDKTEGTLDLSSSTVAHGFWEMVKLGVHHIWIGIDHILFLVALLLPAVVRREGGNWVPSGSFHESLIYVVKIVTLFTVAHTITLSAATIGAISLPSRLVESVIAVSIAIAALDVLWPVFRDKIWWIVFAFGLFHGFGFASVLSEIGVPSSYMAYSLLAFNIGVELGQLAIVCVVFPLLYLIRQGWFYRKLCLPAGAAALIVVSMYWFVERGFLIDLPAGAYVNWILAKAGIGG